MTQTRRKLLEHFDDEVREKLRVRDEASREVLGRFEQLLMRLTQHELGDRADFVDDSSFSLRRRPEGALGEAIPLGLYELPRRSGDAHTYRLGHPLAEALLAAAKGRELPAAELRFDYGAHDGKVSLLEPLCGEAGSLQLTLLTVEALDQAEDHLIIAATTKDGRILDEEAARRLLSLPGKIIQSMAPAPMPALAAITDKRRSETLAFISQRNHQFFEAETEKLESWADDLKLGLERELKEMDRQIREAKRAMKAMPTLEEKLAGQKQVKGLESQRNQKRRTLFEAQDEVDRQRESLIGAIEGKLQQGVNTLVLMKMHWLLE
jgi:adenine-specific DNA-methyltransferase